MSFPCLQVDKKKVNHSHTHTLTRPHKHTGTQTFFHSDIEMLVMNFLCSDNAQATTGTVERRVRERENAVSPKTTNSDNSNKPMRQT